MSVICLVAILCRYRVQPQSDTMVISSIKPSAIRDRPLRRHYNGVAMKSPSPDDPDLDARANLGKCADVY
jgi:hypothetical protein